MCRIPYNSCSVRNVLKNDSPSSNCHIVANVDSAKNDSSSIDFDFNKTEYEMYVHVYRL